MSKSIMQDERRCYMTGCTTNLVKHHIYAGGRRQLSEQYGCWIYLIPAWHNMSDFAVHGKNGHDLDMMLKRECQEKFEAIHGHEKFMQIFKKNYL